MDVSHTREEKRTKSFRDSVEYETAQRTEVENTLKMCPKQHAAKKKQRQEKTRHPLKLFRM